MAKRTKVTPATIAAFSKVAPAPAPAPATQVASVAVKLTKRNATPVGAVLVQTDKQPKARAAHVQAAWAAVVAALPATASTLAVLPELQHPACVSGPAFLSYMLRRGFLAAKQ